MQWYRKKGEPLDFNNLPELPPDALAIADSKEITLKTGGTKAPTLLPEDLHYKVNMSCSRNEIASTQHSKIFPWILKI